MKPITQDSIISAIAEQVSTDLAGKTAILNLKNGTYYSLDEVGSPLWALLKDKQRVGDLLQVMVQKYEVEPERCERDLLAFLGKLAEQHLIEIT